MSLPDAVHVEPPLPASAVPLPTAIGVIVLAIIVCYWPILGAQFSYWDDTETILYNEAFNPPTWSSLIHRWARAHQHIYVPLTHTVWHGLALIGLQPEPRVGGYVTALPFKVTSIVVHLLTSVGVLLLARRLIGTGWVAVIAGLLFALHPLQVESVGWSSGLKDLMFGLFAVTCLLIYLGDRDDSGRPRPRGVLLALIALLLAGLSKPTAMIVPVLLLAADRLLYRREWGESIARLVPFFLVGIAFAIFARILQPPADFVSDVPIWFKPMLAIDSGGFYLQKLLLPTQLAFDYGRSPDVVFAQFRETPWRWLIALIMVGAALFAVLRCRQPVVLFGALFVLLPIAPVLGLVKFDYAYYSVVADHYAYLSLAGVSIIAAALLARVPAHHLKRVFPAAIIVLTAWGVLSFRQSLTWRDPESVSRQTIRVNPNSFASLGNIATAMLRRGEMDEAEQLAKKAFALRPHDPASIITLSVFAEERGDFTNAIEFARQARDLSPGNARYSVRLGDLLGRNDQFEEAIAAYEVAAKIDPNQHYAREMIDRTRRYLRSTAATQAATQPATQPRQAVR